MYTNRILMFFKQNFSQGSISTFLNFFIGWLDLIDPIVDTHTTDWNRKESDVPSLESWRMLWRIVMFLNSFSFFNVTFLSSVSQYPILLCTVFDAVSSNTGKALSVNLSSRVFVFAYFNIHLKEWLTFSSRTDRTSFFYFFSNGLIQINSPTHIPECDFHSPVLNALLSSEPIFFSGFYFIRKF